MKRNHEKGRGSNGTEFNVEDRWPELFDELTSDDRRYVLNALASNWYEGWKPKREDVENLTDFARGSIDRAEYSRRVDMGPARDKAHHPAGSTFPGPTTTRSARARSQMPTRGTGATAGQGARSYELCRVPRFPPMDRTPRRKATACHFGDPPPDACGTAHAEVPSAQVCSIFTVVLGATGENGSRCDEHPIEPGGHAEL